MYPWMRRDYEIFKDDMRDDNEKRIFQAIKENDAESLKNLSTDFADSKLGSNEISILWVAMLKGGYEVVKFLIDNGCDSGEIDENGNNALHLIVSDYVCHRSKTYRLNIVDTLLTSYPKNVMEAVFLDTNKNKMTPFLLACNLGLDEIILHFLALLENGTVSFSIDRLIGNRNFNAFHFLVDSYGRAFFMSAARLDIVLANLIDKIPFAIRLIDSKNDDGETLLSRFMQHGRFNDNSENETVKVCKNEVVQIFLKHGASPDEMYRDDRSYLQWAMTEMLSDTLVEILLRTGCRTANTPIFSPMRHLVSISIYRWYRYRRAKSQSIRMIELLLAFGFDLQKELYLYTIDERPLEFTSLESELRNTYDMDPDILETLREIRRSNILLSLQRQCRNTLRRHLKGKADEVIRNLTCIPDKIKSFLLMENEAPLLPIVDG